MFYKFFKIGVQFYVRPKYYAKSSIIFHHMMKKEAFLLENIILEGEQKKRTNVLLHTTKMIDLSVKSQARCQNNRSRGLK